MNFKKLFIFTGSFRKINEVFIYQILATDSTEKIILLGVKSEIVQVFIAYTEKKDLSAFKNVATI